MKITKISLRRSWLLYFLIVLTIGLVANRHAKFVEGSPEECNEIVLEDGTVLIDCPVPEEASEQAQEHAQPHASMNAGIASTHRIDRDCPPPTVGNPNGHCILPKDVVIDHTWELGSFTTLDCKGHKLSPSSPGVKDDQTTPINEYEPSVPSTAILIHETYGIKIQNCVIDNFDFGIVALKSKISPELRAEPDSISFLSTKILNNIITVKYKGILGAQVDALQVLGNTIEMTYINSEGIRFNYDSDLNNISNNTITLPSGTTANARAPDLPGGPVFIAAGMGAGTPAAFRLSGLLGARETGLLNYIVGDELIQAKFVEGEWPEDNTFEGNIITIQNTGSRGMSADQRPIRTIIRGNTFNGQITSGPLVGQNVAILSAGGAGRTVLLPGTCTGDLNRACSTNADCNIAGFPPVGTCSGTILKTFDVTPEDGVIENNTVTGFRGDGISTSGKNYVVKGNTISGVGGFGIQMQSLNGILEGNTITNSGSNTTSGGDRSGINIFGECFNTCTVTRNILDANDFGISVDKGGVVAQDTATAPRAKIYLNDIINSTKWAVHTFNLGTTPINVQVPPDPLPSGALSYDYELSEIETLRGNYWGGECSYGGGFRDAVLYRSTPFGTIDSSDPKLKDSHPYEESVAGKTDEELLEIEPCS